MSDQQGQCVSWLRPSIPFTGCALSLCNLVCPSFPTTSPTRVKQLGLAGLDQLGLVLLQNKPDKTAVLDLEPTSVPPNSNNSSLHISSTTGCMEPTGVAAGIPENKLYVAPAGSAPPLRCPGERGCTAVRDRLRRPASGGGGQWHGNTGDEHCRKRGTE